MLLLFILFLQLQKLLNHFVCLDFKVIVEMFTNFFVQLPILTNYAEITLHYHFITWYFLLELEDSFDTSKKEGTYQSIYFYSLKIIQMSILFYHLQQKILFLKCNFQALVLISDKSFQFILFFRKKYIKIITDKNMSYLSKTIKKSVSGELKKIKSHDDIHRSLQLSLSEVKILLSCDHETNLQSSLSHRVKKQQILQRSGIFNPQKYFSKEATPINSVQQSARIHSARLQSMFPSVELEKSKKQRGGSRKQSLIMGKSPKNYVKQNKENYQKMNVNKMQKVRMKLKINKKN